MESVALIAFTQAGCRLALRLAHGLAKVPAFAHASFSVSGPGRFVGAAGSGEFEGVEAYESLGSWTKLHFAHDDALVFVGASGIAVRAIAPHVRDKFTDPAVVSVDEAGRFSVPLLSGHVGGANELARAVADVAGGQAAVSTATDVNGLFAVDEWAARHDLAIVERAVAKEISARLLEGGTVGFASDFALDWELPAGVVEGVAREGAAATGEGVAATGEGAAAGAAAAAAEVPADLGFAVTLDDACAPFARTLHLVPRIAAVGVGCRKGADPDVLERAVDAALAKAGVSRHAVGTLASIDVKRGEPAIERLAESRGWDLTFYTAEQLAAVPGDFASSAFVEKTVGVGNVCERAACANGAELVLGRQSGDGVTVAIALRDARTA